MTGNDGLAPTLSDLAMTYFSARGTARDVCRLGEGRAVIVTAEISGITPEVAATRVALEQLLDLFRLKRLRAA